MDTSGCRVKSDQAIHPGAFVAGVKAVGAANSVVRRLSIDQDGTIRVRGSAHKAGGTDGAAPGAAHPLAGYSDRLPDYLTLSFYQRPWGDVQGDLVAAGFTASDKVYANDADGKVVLDFKQGPHALGETFSLFLTVPEGVAASSCDAVEKIPVASRIKTFMAAWSIQEKADVVALVLDAVRVFSIDDVQSITSTKGEWSHALEARLHAPCTLEENFGFEAIHLSGAQSLHAGSRVGVMVIMRAGQKSFADLSVSYKY